MMLEGYPNTEPTEDPVMAMATGSREADLYAIAAEAGIDLHEEPIYVSRGPRGPIWSPSTTDTIHVPYTIPHYRSMGDAWRHNNPSGELYAGQYYVFRRLNDMLHLTRYLGQPSGIWVNPMDLQPRKAAYDWHDSYEELPQPQYYIGLQKCDVIDVEGISRPLKLYRNQPILIAGFFTGPDGTVYGAPQDARNMVPAVWYGVDRDCIEEHFIAAQVPEPLPAPVQPRTLYDRIMYMLANSYVLKGLQGRQKDES